MGIEALKSSWIPCYYVGSVRGIGEKIGFGNDRRAKAISKRKACSIPREKL